MAQKNGTIRIPFLNRFEMHVDLDSSGCWNWLLSKSHERGYLFIGGGDRREEKASRVSYRIFVGAIPDGLYVLHRCDNPACVNPEHLFVGTQLDNMADARAKGRTNRKLDEKGVLEIRRLCSENIVSRGQIAIKFGVSKTTVSEIHRRVKWSHLK